MLIKTLPRALTLDTKVSLRYNLISLKDKVIIDAYYRSRTYSRA